MAIPLMASPRFAAVSMSIDGGECPPPHVDYGNVEALLNQQHDESCESKPSERESTQIQSTDAIRIGPVKE